MAGFAINVRKILDKPKVRVGFVENGKPTNRGYLETSFLENFATRKTVECRGPTNEVYSKMLRSKEDSYHNINNYCYLILL